MSSSEESKETPTVPNKESIVSGFQSLAAMHQNIASHLLNYSEWLEKTDLQDSAIQLQVELIQSLHNRLQ